MKKLFRLIALALCLMMATPSILPNTGIETVQAATKSKIKLNHTKKTIYEGDTFKLKISGTTKKVTWSSSNKKVATVTSKGVVKGVNGGSSKRTCTITAKVGGKKYTCKVTVKKYTPEVSYAYIRKMEHDNNVIRYYLELLDQRYDPMTADGNVDLRMVNNGKTVYQGTVKFAASDFEYILADVYYGYTYAVCVEIPVSDITPGIKSSGDVYFSVYGDDYSLQTNDQAVDYLPQVQVDTNSYISDNYAPENKVQIIDYNITDTGKAYFTCKIVQVGDPRWISFASYIYEYDKDGNMIDDIWIFNSSLNLGETFVVQTYLDDETVWVGVSGNSSNSSSSNVSTDTDSKTSASVSENISTLKQYISKYGKTNTNGDKFISHTSGGHTSSIVYVVQTGELRFATSSGDSGLIMSMTSANNSSSLQVDYVMYSSGVGVMTTGYVYPSTYSLYTDIRFTITETNTSILTDDDVQELCNSELRVGFTGWQVALYENLQMTLQDIGFTSYN